MKRRCSSTTTGAREVRPYDGSGETPGFPPLSIAPPLWNEHQEKQLAFVRARKESGKPDFGLYDARRPRGNRVLLPEMWLE
ncbi:MAG: hypothetical protein LBK99_22890 [Opitutaceae bacterium]|jgi:hypothetical protein|nr:hypothetical protein [Opitutaceae bacterium]